MYPRKTKEFETSRFEIFIDVKDFFKFSFKSFKNPKTLLMYLHKNFHF